VFQSAALLHPEPGDVRQGLAARIPERRALHQLYPRREVHPVAQMVRMPRLNQVTPSASLEMLFDAHPECRTTPGDQEQDKGR